MEIFSHANVEKKTEKRQKQNNNNKKLNDFKFCIFIGRFEVISWHWKY